MHLDIPLDGKALIPQPQVCQLLGKSRSGLLKLRQNDPDFPTPLKPGHGRQARCYYVAGEIRTWLLIQISKRDLV